MRQKFYCCIAALFLLSVVVSCVKLRGHYGTRSYEPVARSLNPADIKLPPGYQAQVVAEGLTYPTAITFDETGKMYVVEAGYSYGEIFTLPRLLRVDPSGVTEVAKGSGENGPWTNVDFYEGNFYVSEGGVKEGGKILKIGRDGKVNPVLSGLPSLGDHHTNGVIIKDGFIYFGQGSATNSGVVGKDNFEFGWLKRERNFHDIPCDDIYLAGENFKTENVLSEEHEKVETGAYVPYGTKTSAGQLIKGQVPCTGAVMRIPVNGGTTEVVAWGFRNPYGLAFSPDGNLYVSDNGYDRRGSRPVYGAGDLLWKVQNGAWHGWPDFSGKDSLAGENYQNREFRPKSVLAKHPNRPPKPAAVFGVHSSADGLDFSRSQNFGEVGKAFVALFGDMAPNVGDVYGPVGYKVVMVDVNTGDVVDFMVNRGATNGPASHLKTGGIERPVSVKFGPDGKDLYVVDFGVLEMPKEGPSPKKKTGVIWKISKQ